MSEIHVDDEVVVDCPKCGAEVSVTVVVYLKTEDGEQRLVPEVEAGDLWAHVWNHGRPQ